MDLRKFKFVSVLLLLAALLLLTFGYVRRTKSGEQFPQSAAEDLAALMEKGGILITPDQIPLRRETRPVYVCRTADGETAKKFAAAVCASSCANVNLTENGFLFRTEDGSLSEIHTDLKINITLNRAFASVDTLPNDEKIQSIEKRLRGLFTAQYADRDVTLVGVKRIYTLLQDGKLYTCFALTLDGTEIYRAALTAATDGEGQLLSLSGDGYLLPLERRVFSQQTDQLNILATELQAHKTSGAGTRTVASVSECYVPSLSSDGTLLRFLPAWKITYTDHGESVYDTVNKGKYVIP